ncbi:MAG: sugar phosphate isomerase/epimerase family protein [Bacteroidota bacterium]
MSNRRSAIKIMVAGTAAGVMGSFTLADAKPAPKLKGNIKQSAALWCFKNVTIDQLCATAKRLGLAGIDLIGPKDWPTLKQYGLTCTMCNGAENTMIDGWNTKTNHPELIKRYSDMIELMGKEGYKNLICFSGNRRGIDNETGMNNCIEGLKQILPLARKHNVVIMMELINSKLRYTDYQCDHSAWAVELCKRIDSENFKILYDIFHAQVAEGDIVRTIQANHQYFGHYHTGGLPDRHTMDDTQELNYPAIMKAILATGYKGYVGQEFVPLEDDKMAELEKAVRYCDV